MSILIRDFRLILDPGHIYGRRKSGEPMGCLCDEEFGMKSPMVKKFREIPNSFNFIINEEFLTL